jgi:hypothetical protein
MELTTELIIRSKPNTITIDVAPKVRRRPSPADWQRWAATIAVRYKRVPARLLIVEMEADGLLVT